MSTVIIFAGTTEGRMLSEELSGKQIPVTACVATEYGETLLTENRYLKVHAGRMDREQIAGFIQREGAGRGGGCHTSVCGGGIAECVTGMSGYKSSIYPADPGFREGGSGSCGAGVFGGRSSRVSVGNRRKYSGDHRKQGTGKIHGHSRL